MTGPGGSAMMAALSLQRLRQSHRSLYLYDTYEGMTQPTERDVDFIIDDFGTERRETLSLRRPQEEQTP